MAESDETNNCGASSTPTIVGLPDLVESSVFVPAEGIPGGTAVIQDSVSNAGAVSSASSTTRYYLSMDDSRGSTDLLLTGSRSVASLAPGQTLAGSKKVTIPSATPTTTYRVIACSDDLNKLKETSESNNCTTSERAIVVGWPDLTIVNVTSSVDQASSGEKFTVLDTVSNVGTVSAPASAVRFYLSADMHHSLDDTLLSGSRSIKTLVQAGSSTGRTTAAIPAGTPAGQYYLIACADATNKVSESIEINNCASGVSTFVVR